MKIKELLKHRIYTYLEFFRYVVSRVKSASSVRSAPDKERENNYWGYISSLNDEKRKRCPHTSLRKVSRTKFYCQDCGAELRYIREEVSIISELAVVALCGFLIYQFLKRTRLPSED